MANKDIPCYCAIHIIKEMLLLRRSLFWQSFSRDFIIKGELIEVGERQVGNKCYENRVQIGSRQ